MITAEATTVRVGGEHNRRSSGARSRTRRSVLALTVALGLALSACSGSNSTPPPDRPTDPAAILAASSTAMAGVDTAHFTLAVDGTIQGVTISKADGDLTRGGDAKGTATISQFGQLVEAQFVLKDGRLFIKGPTGGFVEVPASATGSLYDPSAILDPQRGVAAVLAKASGPTLASSDDSASVVTATVPQAVAAALVPGLQSDVQGTFTVAASENTLTSARFDVTDQSLTGGRPASVTVDLSDLNAPVDVTVPS